MIRTVCALLLVLAPGLVGAVDPLPFADETEHQRYRALAAELRCLVCQNQSLADSPATLAGDMRRIVLEQMRAGKSDDEIKTYLTDRYGDFVLYRPPLDRRTWWLWFGPGVIAIIGLAVVFIVVRRRRRVDGSRTLSPAENDEW